jgi:hypothetical protein
VAQKIMVFSSPVGSSSLASRLDLARTQVDGLDLLALAEVDALLAQKGLVADGWLIVDQPVVSHGLAIGVGVDRLAEDLGGVARRRGGQAHLDGIEVVERTPVRGHVLGLIAQRQLALGHLLIQRVAAMGLVHDDAIVGIHGRRSIAGEHALDHGLHGGHLDARFGLGGHVTQVGDVVDLAQRLVLLQRRLLEGVHGLIAQGRAIDQEQDAPEALGLQEPIHQPDDRARLAGAGRHRQQAAGLSLGQSGFDRGNRMLLVVAQAEVAKAFLLQLCLGVLLAALQLVQQARGRMETLQRLGQLGRLTHVSVPSAAGLRTLLDERTAVAGVDEGHMEVTALAVRPGPRATFQRPCRFEIRLELDARGVALCLADLARHVHVQALGFDGAHRRQAGEQHVVGALLARAGPFCNGLVLVRLGPRTLGVGQAYRIGLPTRVRQHLIDDDPGGRLVHRHLLRSLCRTLGEGLQVLGAGGVGLCVRLRQFGVELGLQAGIAATGFLSEGLVDAAFLLRTLGQFALLR